MDIVKNAAKPVGMFLLTILGLSFSHWGLVQFYATNCAPWSWTGPLTSVISLGSPVCQFTNHLQVAIANYYVTIWAASAGACIVWIATQLGKTPISTTVGGIRLGSGALGSGAAVSA